MIIYYNKTSSFKPTQIRKYLEHITAVNFINDYNVVLEVLKLAVYTVTPPYFVRNHNFERINYSKRSKCAVLSAYNSITFVGK